MNTAWTKGLKKGSQDAKDVEEAFASSAYLRRRLVEIIEDMYQSEMAGRLKSNDYENAAWPFKQADAVGYARALKRLQNILEEK